MKVNRTFLYGGIFTILIGLFLYALIIGLTPGYTFKRKNVFAFYLLSSSLIRNLPQPKIVGEAEFFSSPRDGNSPESSGVSFCSSDTRKKIIEKLDRYALENGFVKKTYENIGFREHVYFKENGNNLFQFSLSKFQCRKNSWRVIADESWYY